MCLGTTSGGPSVCRYEVWGCICSLQQLRAYQAGARKEGLKYELGVLQPAMQGQEDLQQWLLTQLHCSPGGLLWHCCQLPSSPSQQVPDQGNQQPPGDHFAAMATTEACRAGLQMGNCSAWPLPCTQQQWETAWGLPGDSMVPAWQAVEGCCSGGQTFDGGAPLPTDWLQYYQLRHIRPSSPAGECCVCWGAGVRAQPGPGDICCMGMLERCIVHSPCQLQSYCQHAALTEPDAALWVTAASTLGACVPYVTTV